ncbi:MAG: Hsp33 family molecular chaperone HslO [Lachnospiraceae bacterium]|nr:Hsp33 family molecular chaperone HslO [Lachnospiraceae bacterium]
MNDYIVRAVAANDQIRAFACTTKETVEEARRAHNTSPIITAALGRLLTAGAMMGAMLKGEKDILTLQIKSEGPAKGLTVTANSKAEVKGYAVVPDVMLPPNAIGKLDVGGALGLGMLSVIKDMGLKDPYVGQVELQTGEIAEDLTYYFATSEQVPSCVGLGVLMEKNNTVRQAGGFIIQLMPFADDAVIDKLEENLKKIKSVTTMLDEGNSPEEMLKLVLEGFDIKFNETMPTRYKCDCSRSRVEKALISIGQKDLQQMIDDNEGITVECHFCDKSYKFTTEDLVGLVEKAK